MSKKIKYQIELSGEEVKQLYLKLSLKQNPIWVELRKKLEKLDLCLNCGRPL